jgi:calcineurin-like phosphoesterase family protein
MDIWFTGDTHFNHANICRLCKRPWLRDGDVDSNGNWINNEIKYERGRQTDDGIVDNWNRLVKKGDIVYHVGDFGFFKYSSDIERYIRSLNGNIHLILGNHDDYDLLKKINGFTWLGKPYQGKMIKVCGQRIFLFHTSCMIWDRSHHGSWHLYGHSHGTLPDNPNLLSMDVGVDACGYKPISFDEVARIMSAKKFVPVDHHGDN